MSGALKIGEVAARKETIASKVQAIQKKIVDLENLSTELTTVFLRWEDCGGSRQPECSPELM